MKLQLSVVIVNYRTPEMVVDCVESLLPELENLSFQILVVDNDSGDHSIDTIQSWMRRLPEKAAQQIRLIRSECNGGFAYGNNLGIRSEVSDYYLLLNSDTLLRRGAISRLLETAEADTGLGLIGPRLEFSDGRVQESCFREHSAASELVRGAQLSVVSRLLRGSQIPVSTEEPGSEIEWMSFACILIRRQVFRDIGLLDQGYFMYFEDAEFCRRARNGGWRLKYCAAARVVHLRGGSSPVKSRKARRDRLPRYYYESRTRFFRQKGGLGYLFLANLFWGFGRGLCLAKRIFGKSDEGAVRGEWRDLWIGASTTNLPERARSAGRPLS